MNVTQIEALIEDYKLLAKGQIDFNKYTWYSITHHSTSIEGSTLTESQVINLLEYGKPAPNKPFEHHLMVTDYFNALKFTIEQVKEKQKISPTFIQETAAHVMKNTDSEVNTIAGNYDTSKGDFRKGTVRAGTRIFPDYKKVEQLISALCEKANQKILTAKTLEEKCNLAFWLHFELVSIHPFGDGNGRTSRLLMNYIQAYFDLPLSVVFKTDRIKYINALEAARNSENISAFYHFMYQQYAKFLKAELTELKK